MSFANISFTFFATALEHKLRILMPPSYFGLITTRLRLTSATHTAGCWFNQATIKPVVPRGNFLAISISHTFFFVHLPFGANSSPEIFHYIMQSMHHNWPLWFFSTGASRETIFAFDYFSQFPLDLLEIIILVMSCSILCNIINENCQTLTLLFGA